MGSLYPYPNSLVCQDSMMPSALHFQWWSLSIIYISGPRVGVMLAVLARTGVCAFIIPQCAPAVLAHPQQSLPSAYHSVPRQLSPARLARFCTLGIHVKKQGFQTAWLITGQKFQGLGLKLTAVILTFRDLASHLCHKIIRMAR